MPYWSINLRKACSVMPSGFGEFGEKIELGGNERDFSMSERRHIHDASARLRGGRDMPLKVMAVVENVGSFGRTHGWGNSSVKPGDQLRSGWLTAGIGDINMRLFWEGSKGRPVNVGLNRVVISRCTHFASCDVFVHQGKSCRGDRTLTVLSIYIHRVSNDTRQTGPNGLGRIKKQSR